MERMTLDRITANPTVMGNVQNVHVACSDRPATGSALCIWLAHGLYCDLQDQRLCYLPASRSDRRSEVIIT
jgi:hypothetical protein